jgi:hypothetical protein
MVVWTKGPWPFPFSTEPPFSILSLPFLLIRPYPLNYCTKSNPAPLQFSPTEFQEGPWIIPSKPHLNYILQISPPLY